MLTRPDSSDDLTPDDFAPILERLSALDVADDDSLSLRRELADLRASLRQLAEAAGAEPPRPESGD